MHRQRRMRRNNDADNFVILLFVVFIALIVYKSSDSSESSEKELVEDPSPSPTLPPTPTVVWLSKENNEFYKPPVEPAELTIVCYSDSLEQTENDYTPTLKVEILFDSVNYEIYDGNDETEILANFHSNTPVNFDPEFKGKELDMLAKRNGCLGIYTESEYEGKIDFSYSKANLFYIYPLLLYLPLLFLWNFF